MTKFNPGDRVVYNSKYGDGSWQEEGSLGTVVRDNGNTGGLAINFDRPTNGANPRNPTREHIQLVAVDPQQPIIMFATSEPQKLLKAEVLGVTMDGNLIVGTKPGVRDSDWFIFTPHGDFVRSAMGSSGSALRIRNGSVQVMTKYRVEVGAYGVQFIKLTADLSTANLEVVTEDDKIVSITPKG